MSDEAVPDIGSVTVAVVVGGFAFDVLNLHRLFRDLAGVDAYIQDVFNFVADLGNHRHEYDVVLFFHHYVETPPLRGGVAEDWRGRPVRWLDISTQKVSGSKPR